MEWLDGGVTTPKGFRASAIRSGLKKEGLDLALIECPGEAACAGLFTLNAVKAAPVLVSMDNIRASGGVARAVVVNSGNANACNGPKGLQIARKMAQRCARLLDTSPEKVLVASTGVIGRPLSLEKVLSGVESAVPQLSSSRSAGKKASEAIMTTDSVPKEAALRIRCEDGCITLGGMAKGVGMIHPELATMLAFITTDARIDAESLSKALREAADQSFNMITIDRDTSTNDTLFALSSGLSACPSIHSGQKNFSRFREGITQLCINLAKQMVRDGEGASKIFEVEVTGAENSRDARLCARSIAGSNLVKSAIFGLDPNWGRIIAAAGYSGAKIDQELVGLILETPDGKAMEWVANGRQISERRNTLAEKIMEGSSFKIKVDLGLGCFKATSWGCDLSYDYVRINSEYTS